MFAESLRKLRHETYVSPALLSRPPSHESFVAEVEVAGAVRSLSEQQEEANVLTPFLTHASMQTLGELSLCLTGTALMLSHRQPPDPPVSVSAVINFPDFQWTESFPSLPPPAQVTLMLGVPASPLGVCFPLNAPSQRPELRR